MSCAGHDMQAAGHAAPEPEAQPLPPSWAALGLKPRTVRAGRGKPLLQCLGVGGAQGCVGRSRCSMQGWRFCRPWALAGVPGLREMHDATAPRPSPWPTETHRMGCLEVPF